MMQFSLASLSLDRSVTSVVAVIYAVIALLKLLSLTLIGLVLAHPKIQLLPKETFNLLCKLVFVLFLPCLIFTHLGPSISFNNFINWWFIPVNVVISTAIGCILGCLVAIICRPPTEFYRFTIIMIALGNTGNIPFAIVASICHSTDSPFGPDCYGSGVAYVSFAQWVSVILVYTLVYHMMEPPLDCYEIVEEENEIEELPPVDDPSRPLLVEAEWPVLEDKETEHCKTPLIAMLFNSISSVSQTNVIDPESVEEEGEGSPKPVRCLAEPRMVKKIRIAAKQTPIQHIIQPPTIASLLAIIIGMIPQLKAIVYGSDAPLAVITDSLDIIAGAMVPSVMLVLGGMLAEGPNESRLGTRTTVGIIVARLLVCAFAAIYNAKCHLVGRNCKVKGLCGQGGICSHFLAACGGPVFSVLVHDCLLRAAAFLCLGKPCAQLFASLWKIIGHINFCLL
ncbi:Mem_trans domain-containing protein [Cephalotus follicularis]|uniref:Mem_trans domain-containing protein n=1 Tax=Cephalotus follicularis TaxID=3775 RepID=A0A1Q3C6A6_CEPFO|nr:Mem_trans domain-containing protein [Cephalotus follicularis]